MAKVSVIVPVYNAEKYLQRCLDSVMGQTLSDIEIICVNDGSTDESPQILEAYAERDSRIKVIHKEKGGLVLARKTGLTAAEGIYIGYVDSDDWIEPNMYERLYEIVSQHGCDIAASGLFRQFSDSIVKVTNTVAAGVYDRDAAKKKIQPYMLYNGIYYQMGVRPNLVNKLFKKELLLHTQMNVPENITNGEDAAVTYPSLLNAEKIVLTDEIYYHYRQHDSSMSKAIGSWIDISGVRALYRHLREAFDTGDCADIMIPQLNAYISNMLVQRCFSIYDRGGECFSVFGGGITLENVIAIYGAGNFGRQVYDYAIKKGMRTFWADQRYEFYQKKGLDVVSVEELMKNRFDYLLIAIMDKTTAETVRKNLTGSGIACEKIRWLDTERLMSKEMLNVLVDGDDVICSCVN